MQKRTVLAENIHITGDGKGIEIIDQTKLPGKRETLVIDTLEDMVEAIQKLRVRGAPAIGIFAAYGAALLAEQSKEGGASAAEWKEQVEVLAQARPTAVNLRWALDRMLRVFDEAWQEEDFPLDGSLKIPETVARRLEEEAVLIQREDIETCRSIAELGLSLLKDGDGVLTHCNAGPLATSRYGTALGPLILGTEEGMTFRVFADETRPLLQGARLTAYELMEAGVDVTLICDNMASLVMKQGKVQACLVGCDRIAANGDTANKIGTSGVAVLAKHYGIPFYVLGPTSTIDLACESGEDIPIEERDGREITEGYIGAGTERIAPEGVRTYDPAFDVTDHELITAIVTEKAILYPPFDAAIAALFLG